MFGIWRLVLAMIVVFSHLRVDASTDVAWTGYYAVRAFFILSGYLMTLILQEKYGFSLYGLGRFLWNRCLRILPSYYAAVVCSILLLLIFGEANVSAYQPRIRWPVTWGEAWPNLTVIGLTNQHPVRLVPPAWALDIELVFYLLMAAGLAASRTIGAVWLTASVIRYFLPLLWPELDLPEHRYLLASIDFATGSMIYHLRRSWGDRTDGLTWLIAVSLGLWGVPFLANSLGFTDPHSKMLTLYRFTTAGVVWMLAGVRVERTSRLAKLDKFWGDLSYPVYLLHWQCGFLCAATLPLERESWLLASISAIFVLVAARVEVVSLSGPIESFRHDSRTPRAADPAVSADSRNT